MENKVIKGHSVFADTFCLVRIAKAGQEVSKEQMTNALSPNRNRQFLGTNFAFWQTLSIKAVAAEHDNVKNRERPVAAASAFVRSTKDPKYHTEEN